MTGFWWHGTKFRAGGASSRLLHWPYLQKWGGRGARPLQGQQHKGQRAWSTGARGRGATRQREDRSPATWPVPPGSPPRLPCRTQTACSKRPVASNLQLLTHVCCPSLTRQGDDAGRSRSDAIRRSVPGIRLSNHTLSRRRHKYQHSPAPGAISMAMRRSAAIMEPRTD